jgi:hypothetical protein
LVYNYSLNMCWALDHQNILEMAQGHISLSAPESRGCTVVERERGTRTV